MTITALRIVYRNLAELVRSVGHLCSYAAVFVCAFLSSRAKTAATVVALRSQLAQRIDRVQQKKEPKPRFTPAFRVVWVVISRVLDGWENLAQLMKPATVRRWHTEGFRLWCRWKSRKRGRPSLEQEMQALIRKLSRENPLWSAERIRDTLLLLGWRSCSST
ncbi:MAG TPA: helix-turn-helix domain-containing protein [Armatimonadota bacterium]|nr:helix-turn-helix domain-containing protein [Armatimonadota bacterium]